MSRFIKKLNKFTAFTGPSGPFEGPTGPVSTGTPAPAGTVAPTYW